MFIFEWIKAENTKASFSEVKPPKETIKALIKVARSVFYYDMASKKTREQYRFEAMSNHEKDHLCITQNLNENLWLIT